MHKNTLADHKKAVKHLTTAPSFGKIKRGKLPKPLHNLGGINIQVTDLIPVGEGYSAWFMWKGGEVLEQTAFYGYLFMHVGAENLYPLSHFHWHPSHKSIHIKMPCGTDLN